MSTAGISFGGLASGLDTKAIISALLAIEERPIQALTRKKSDISRQKSLFGDLDGLLDKLTEAAKKLKQTTGFLQMTATSDQESILTARADSSATPGSYSVTVNSLATTQVNSAGAASPTDAIGSGIEFVLDVGGQSIPITPGGDSLEAIAAAINAQDDALELGVRAEVIDTGAANPDPSQRYQLVVRSTEPGTENAFSLTYSEGGPAFEAFLDDLNTDVQAAQNAELEVNGITVYRSTNTVSDLFGGITIDLKSADPNEEVTITVATNAEETSKIVKEFVDAYNKVVDFFATQNELDSEGKAKSPLFGDATLRSMRSSLRFVVGSVVETTGNPAYQMLAQIGIKTDTAGKLTFEQSKFEEALSDDENAVTRLFTDATAGIAGRLEEQIDVYTDSVDGLIKARNDGFDRLVKQTQSRIDQAERRLTLYEQQLQTKYANLETLLGRLQSQGSSVGNIAQSFGR